MRVKRSGNYFLPRESEISFYEDASEQGLEVPGCLVRSKGRDVAPTYML